VVNEWISGYIGESSSLATNETKELSILFVYSFFCILYGRVKSEE
jgi:hypothetical protein